jgi:hypothetical protein
MRYYEADKDLSLGIDFKVNGEFVVPVLGSVKATLRTQSGAIRPEWNNVVLTTTEETTSLSVAIPAEDNEIADEMPEARHLSVDFVFNNQQYNIRQSYYLIEWLNISSTTQEVRDYYGLTSREIADEDVSFERLYFTLAKEVGLDDLAELFTNVATNLDANRLLVMMAVRELIPSLQLRLRQSERSDQVQYLRLFRIEFDRITQDVAGEIASLRTALGLGEGDVETSKTLLILSQPTDVITGGETT